MQSPKIRRNDKRTTALMGSERNNSNLFVSLTYGLFANDYRVATLPKLYLSVIGIIMQSLNWLDKELSVTDGRTLLMEKLWLTKMADLYLKSCGCWVKKSAHHFLSHFPHPQLPHLHQQLPHLRPQKNFYSWIIYYLISARVLGIGHSDVYYTSPQSFKIIRWLNIFGTFI